MSFIQLKTELPGPRSQEWMERMYQSVGKAKAEKTLVPAIIDHAEGALINDIDGNRFIDLAGGVGSLNVGHSHPLVVQAIQEAATRFTHTDYTVVPYSSYIELAEELCRRAPGDFSKKAVFMNSGAEAVESAIKIARKATGKKAIICFDGAFHGRTMMALTLTSKVRPYKEGMGPFAPDVYRVPFPYVYRWPGSPSEEEVCRQALEYLENTFSTQVSPDETAAIIMEPIQGENGFIVPPAGYLKGVQEICYKYKILLICDEVQTGFGRTGEFLASTIFGIEPDLITLGKSIAGGLPLSGVVGRTELLDSAGDGSIGGTFVGNPVACSAALAVLKVYDAEQLGERAKQIGEQIVEALMRFAERSMMIGEIRGMGAMRAVELVRNQETREPATEETNQIIKRCLARGVIIFKAGLHGNVIRFLTPLVITPEQLAEALQVLLNTMREVEEEFTPGKEITAV
ncbi:4-aminobutyrate aminotransferase/(S)-3-amino-2-methylpropionate transaminase [Croceifilum oryzae]|uniref:(S)-3-amino-2-methylpropionate transaminase n=1 Tax=Croceifilum oryzae TaxID=1553429 RepID=A0AAJ1THP8_9BACL|nr:4-aminobutyrate--2-oxoglutarate transaminase [Croceifilum oryzae]MDQ0418689.1 4-aminobutyrate aminotransferase/(S)-3-amino-2-methylpropionate transaminase [Croceifilum oryzae]